jgi:ParB-like chromosome segregation protein Spo0J
MSAQANVTKSQHIKAQMRSVKFSQIQLNAPRNAFREAHELKSEAVEPLADHMAAHGLTTPWLVLELPDDEFLGGDCHRRWHAVKHNIDRGVAGFSADMEIPVHVLPEGTADLEFVHMAIGSNEHRQNLSDIGRIKAAVRLKQLGESNKAIGEALRTSERTVARLLLLGTNPFWMQQVSDHSIGVTKCTSLVAAATEVDRLPDLVAAYEVWLTNAKREIEAEVQRRKANDEPALSLVDQQPQKWLKTAQVTAWLEALKSGGELGEPDFKYRAGLSEGPGARAVEVDSLKMEVDKLSAEHAIKLAGRFGDLSQDLEKIAREKKAAEDARRQAADTAGERPSSR